MIIWYPRMGMNHTWQVYVTTELKIKLCCFFNSSTMVWILIGIENRYFYLSIVPKFVAIQNELKQAEMK